MSDVSAPAHVDDFSLADSRELADDLNDDLRLRIKRELDPGERLLWAASSVVPPFHLGRGFLCLVAVALFLIVSGVSYVSYALWQPRRGEISCLPE